MSNWSGEKTFKKQKMKLWEMHLQGLFRGIKLERDVGGVQTVVYYFLGDPHNHNSYTTDSGKFYKQALDTLGAKWANDGVAPQGQVKIGGTGVSANFRGSEMAMAV